MSILSALKKSWLYLFFVIAVTVMIVGGISLILSIEAQLAKTIGENTYQINITQNSSKNSISNGDLLYWLQNRKEKFVIYKENLDNCLVFSNRWKEEPYNLKNNQIYINKWNAKNEIVEEGISYYWFMGIKYEVTGYINEFTNVIADMTPVLQRDTGASMYGTYYIDAEKDTETMINELQNYLYEQDGNVDFSYEKVQRSLTKELFNQAYALAIFVGCGLLLFIGGFTINSSWADTHIREMFVRRLVGAGELRLMIRLYIEMLGIRVVGMATGCIIVYFMTNLLNLLPNKTVFKVESIYVCVCIFLIMDIIYTFPMILIRQKKKLVQIMR